MALTAADSNVGRISYLRETEPTFGEQITPFDAQIARLTSSSFAANKGTVVSNELRADRMVGDLIESEFTTGGELGFEMSALTYEDFIEAALCGTWSTPVNISESFTVAAATQTITATALSNAFASVVVGQPIFISGMTAPGNNGWHTVASKADDDTITVTTPVEALTDEGPTAATAVGKYCRNGIVKRSYNIEQYFSDRDVAQLFLGQRLGTWNLSLAAGQIVTGAFGFQGTSMMTLDPGSFAGTLTDPTATDVLNATSNIGIIRVDGNAVPCLMQSLDFALDNALRNQMAIGSKYPCGIGYGRQNVNGNLAIYFQDLTFYDLFLNHTDISLEFSLQDNAGNSVHFFAPRVKLGTDTPNLPGIDQDVMEAMTWQAIAHADGYQFQVSVNAAA